MNHPAPTLTRDEIAGLDIIRAFVPKQRALLMSFRSQLGDEPRRFSLRKRAPASLQALDRTWSVAVHGEGAQFKDWTTGECIDVHVGIFDSDESFDAWRLEQYARSIRSKIKDFGPILELLESKGLIHRNRNHSKHYEMSP